jgi:hypothetical protein
MEVMAVITAITIKENYQWTNNGVTYSSKDGIKEMKSTLEDECGTNP